MSTEQTPKKTNWKAIIGMVVGALLVVAGGFSLFQNETFNTAAIQAGATLNAEGILEMYPESKDAIAKVAETIDAAVEARTTSPDQLNGILEGIATQFTGSGYAGVLINSVVTQVNEAYKVSETEEVYHAKLKALTLGLKAALK